MLVLRTRGEFCAFLSALDPVVKTDRSVTAVLAVVATAHPFVLTLTLVEALASTVVQL
jgi:hypothetical protein